MYYILQFLMQPISNMLYSSFQYLFVQLLWRACFYPIISAIILAVSLAASGIAWCVYNFFQIPFINNFLSDICEVFSDLGSAIENGYSFIKSLFSKLPDEIGIKTDKNGVKGYVKYVASNIITIAGFGYLSYHFYNNYYKLFRLDKELNDKRAEYDLERIQTHYPINLFITGTVAALQFSACVATAISIALPGTSMTKFRALAIAGMAEVALRVYEYTNNNSLDDLGKFKEYKDDLTLKAKEVSSLEALNATLSAELKVQSELNNDLVEKSIKATRVITAWGQAVSILGANMNNETKIAQLLGISNCVSAGRPTTLLQNGGVRGTNGVNV